MKHVVVIGCGKSGSSIASTMSSKGYFVTVVDKNKKTQNLLDPSFSGFFLEKTIVDLDSIKTLSENIDLLLVVTENDDLNIYLSIGAKEILGIKHVITRLYDDAKSFAFDNTSIDVIYPSKLAMGEIYNIMGVDR